MNPPIYNNNLYHIFSHEYKVFYNSISINLEFEKSLKTDKNPNKAITELINRGKTLCSIYWRK